jgi:hypothetical protein
MAHRLSCPNDPDAAPVAETEKVGIAPIDSRAGVHDGVGGSTNLSAWNPAPRPVQKVHDDDDMDVTGMPLSRPRSEASRTDNVGNAGRVGTAGPAHTRRGGAGATRRACAETAEMRRTKRATGAAGRVGSAKAHADGKQEREKAGGGSSPRAMRASASRAADGACRCLNTARRSVGFPRPKRQAGAGQGAVNPRQIETTA